MLLQEEGVLQSHLLKENLLKEEAAVLYQMVVLWKEEGSLGLLCQCQW